MSSIGLRTDRLIFKNTAFLTLGKALGDLCSFAFMVFFARAFGADIVGTYAFAMSLGGLLSILVGLGLNTLMVREVSRDKRQNAKYVGGLLVVQSVMALAVWLLIWMVAWAAGFDANTKVIVLLIGSYQILYKLALLFSTTFKAHEEMEYSALLELSHRLIILALGVAGALIWKSPAITLAAYPFSALVIVIMGLLLCISRYGFPDLAVDYRFVKNAIVSSMPFFLTITLLQFYDRAGVIFLTFFQGKEAVGIFSVPDRLLTTILAALAIFASAIFPAMSRLLEHSKDNLLELYERCIRIILVTVLPIATILYILSEEVILLLFGKQYGASVPVLRIMCWALLFSGLNYVLSTFLVACHYHKQQVRMLAIIYALYLGVCLALIPKYSHIGLAYTRLGADGLLCAFYLAYISKKIHAVSLIKIAAAPVLSSLLLIAASRFMIGMSLWLTVPCLLVLSIASLSVFKGIHLSDLIYVRKVIFGG
jgi:O-antigen/teichoic acid export membrane protein